MSEPVCVARATDVHEAWIISARLKAFGIRSRVHGDAVGPYAFTVGAMGRTEVWVACSDAEEARSVLDVSDQEAAVDAE
ncbi:MAG: DUF2007 domain-containing protein [Actinobacteria bacterium]|nr:DUF2007 domain-containing protein [Actinomycetota bacterium]